MPPKPANRTPIPRQAKKTHFPTKTDSDPTPRALSLDPPQPSDKPHSIPSSLPAQKPTTTTSAQYVIGILKQLQDMITSKNNQLEQLLTNKLNTFDARIQDIEQNPSKFIPQDVIQTKLDEESNDVSNNIIDIIEQTTSDLRKEVLEEVDDIREEMDDMNKKYAALSVRYPIGIATKPTITKIPDVSIPKNLAYQLASKTVNVKTLSKELSSITFDTDDIKCIITTYSRISQAVDIACGTATLKDLRSTKTSTKAGAFEYGDTKTD